MGRAASRRTAGLGPANLGQAVLTLSIAKPRSSDSLLARGLDTHVATAALGYKANQHLLVVAGAFRTCLLSQVAAIQFGRCLPSAAAARRAGGPARDGARQRA